MSKARNEQGNTYRIETMIGARFYIARFYIVAKCSDDAAAKARDIVGAQYIRVELFAGTLPGLTEERWSYEVIGSMPHSIDRFKTLKAARGFAELKGERGDRVSLHMHPRMIEGVDDCDSTMVAVWTQGSLIIDRTATLLRKGVDMHNRYDERGDA